MERRIKRTKRIKKRKNNIKGRNDKNSEIDNIIKQQKPFNLEKNEASEKKENNEKTSNNNDIENKSGRANHDTNLVGIPNKDYFQNLFTNNQGSQIFLREWFKFKDVDSDGSFRFRAIAN